MSTTEIIADLCIVIAFGLIVAGCAIVSTVLALIVAGVILLIAGLVLTGLAINQKKPPADQPGVVDRGPFEPGS
ncbi:MAG: hypothetical protein ACSLE4_12810 [Methyloceanibacter sp.]|uniref:hypothetical protein n=1 Tax=Methyloceanibacter sp. TaxID=1965321 RepID=UPI003EDFB9B3